MSRRKNRQHFCDKKRTVHQLISFTWLHINKQTSLPSQQMEMEEDLFSRFLHKEI